MFTSFTLNVYLYGILRKHLQISVWDRIKTIASSELSR